MTADIFLRKMEEVLEIDNNTLELDTKLDELDWDSLAIISTIAIVDQISGVVLTTDVINNCKQLGDIWSAASNANG